MVFGQIEFKKEGIYYIEIIVDEVLKLRFPLPVMIVPPPQKPSQNPSASANDTESQTGGDEPKP